MRSRPNELFKSTINLLQYNPKYETISERASRGILEFKKMKGRIPSLYTNCTPYIANTTNTKNVDDFYNKMNKQKSVPEFDKYYSPKQHENDPLPKFLMGLNNRMGIKIMGPYGLKSNNFRNGRFLSDSKQFTSLPPVKSIKPLIW